MKNITLTLAMLVAVLGAMAKDLRVVTLTTTPQMHCESCEKTIKNNIRFEKGVKKIETDIAAQTVTITYDPCKNTAEQIAKSFAKIGYKAVVLSDSPQKTARRGTKSVPQTGK